MTEKYPAQSYETDTCTVTHCCEPVYRKEFPALAALKRSGVFLHVDWTKFYYGHDVHVGAAILHIVIPPIKSVKHAQTSPLASNITSPQ